MRKRDVIGSFLGVFITMLAASSVAKPVNLYEQPNANSKMVETVDSSSSIITIFTPKDSDWIKVADPRNGNVGWIKASDLGNNKLSINVITTGDSPNSYQIIQFGNTKFFTTEQIQQVVKNIELRQQTIQKDMQKMMQEILNHSQWRFPLIMPATVAPEQKSAMPAASNIQPTTSKLPSGR